MDRSLQRRLQKTNYQHIKRLCRDRGQLFEDPDFPPTNRSIYRHKKPALSPIVWLRPHVRNAYSPYYISINLVVQMLNNMDFFKVIGMKHRKYVQILRGEN